MVYIPVHAHNKQVSSLLQVFLGDYPECWYTEQEANLAVEKFAAKLKQIEASIIHRNKRLDVEYFYLCPSQVPNSITI